MQDLLPSTVMVVQKRRQARALSGILNCSILGAETQLARTNQMKIMHATEMQRIAETRLQRHVALDWQGVQMKEQCVGRPRSQSEWRQWWGRIATANGAEVRMRPLRG